MRQCKASNSSGEPCGAWALKDSDFCFMHDPTRGEERAKARRRGGMRLRPGHGGDLEGIPGKVRTLADVLGVLDYTLAEILILENSLARGRVLIALAAGFVDAIQAGEFEARLAALEEKVFHGNDNKTAG